MQTDTPTPQERGDDSPSVEEIAVKSTVELLHQHHHDACEPVSSITAGLWSTIDEDVTIVSDEPTVDEVLSTAGKLRVLAEFLETRVVPLVNTN